MKNQDIRWIQRFQHYQKALAQLSAAVDLSHQRDLTDLERLGMIHIFEYNHELAWNTLKDLLESSGAINLLGSRDVTGAASANGLIAEGEIWMQMIQSRNESTNAYNEQTAERLVGAVTNNYFKQFERLQLKLEQLRANLD